MAKGGEGVELVDIVKRAGVADLVPKKARNYFALALKWENDGEKEKAEEALGKALRAEEEIDHVELGGEG